MNHPPRPIQVALRPGFDLGRGAGGGGGGGGFRGGGFSRGPVGHPGGRGRRWVPDESGFCGPNAALGSDGLCYYPALGIGQTTVSTEPSPTPGTKNTTPAPYTIPVINEQIPGTILGFPAKTVVIGGALVVGAIILMKVL